MVEGKTTEVSQMDLPAPKPSVGARIKAHLKKWWWVHVIIAGVVVLVIVLPVYVDSMLSNDNPVKRDQDTDYFAGCTSVTQGSHETT